MAAIAANGNETDREVLIPAGKIFYVFNIELKNLVGISLKIDGILATSDNITEWYSIFPLPPHVQDSGHPACLHVVNCTNFELTGSGVFDGQGFDWWVYVFETKIDTRPFLVHMEHSKDVEIHRLFFRNSPFWHFRFDDMLNVHIHEIEVYVDVVKQKEIMQRFNHWDKKLQIPTFPLNTDGMDLGGKNFLVENSKFTVFDDAVAVKPTNSHPDHYANCSQDMLVRNLNVTYAIGMTIGSVPPDKFVNCVRNVTFENIHFVEALKAIYVKTNPGDIGTGIIDGITYRNIRGEKTLWMPIYIGPQQQKQPGTNGTGCSFFYPLDKDCPTQPRVPITNILLENITFVGGILFPGVILCDNTTKCKNISFIDVRNTGKFLLRQLYDCHNVEGTKQNSNRLPFNCMKKFHSTTSPRSTSPRSTSPRTTHSGMSGSTSKVLQSSTQSFLSTTTSETSGASKNYLLFDIKTIVFIIFLTII